jgi:hypothetical protein
LKRAKPFLLAGDLVNPQVVGSILFDFRFMAFTPVANVLILF